MNYPTGWQTYFDTQPFYTTSEEIEGACPAAPRGWDPAGPWEPIGRGDWRRPPKRHEPEPKD